MRAEQYESKLDAFVKEQGLDMGAFMEAAKAELLKGQGSDDWSERSPHGFILRVSFFFFFQATAEYDTSLQMMAEVAQRVKGEENDAQGVARVGEGE